MKCTEDPDDELLFPSIMPDIGGKTFKYVLENRVEWSEFTLTWNNSTGIYKKWFDYVRRMK